MTRGQEDALRQALRTAKATHNSLAKRASLGTQDLPWKRERLEEDVAVAWAMVEKLKASLREGLAESMAASP